MFKITSKKIVAVAAGTSIAVASSVAFAAWTADGSGNGSGKAITESALVVSAGTPTADLYPGAKGDVVITLTNNNPYAVSVADVYHLAADKISSGDGTCDVSGAAQGVAYRAGWADSAPKAVGAIVAGNGGTLTLTVDDGIAMDNTTVDACSGKTFTVPVAVHAASVTSGSPVTTATVTIS